MLGLVFVGWLGLLGPAEGSEARVRQIFEDACTVCHDDSGDPDDPGGLNLDVQPRTLVGKKSVATGRSLIAAGDPEQSYLLAKVLGNKGIHGDIMPVDSDPLSPSDIATIREWIASLPPEGDIPRAKLEAPLRQEGKDNQTTKVSRRQSPPFHGIQQIVLPTTATLGKRMLMYRIDHRFGRIGAERGAFGLDVGAVISMGLAYGILDGWDIQLRRTNSQKGWELGTKYVPVRQEDGKPLSFGAYVSLEYLRDFPANVENVVTGNFMLMFSRLYFGRWSTMLTMGYHLLTNHNERVFIDRGNGPEQVKDKRGTLTLGFASTVWLDRKKNWGLDMEYFLPVPDERKPNVFYYRGGDSDKRGPLIGSWAIGGSYRIGLHFFQVFFTNQRDIHTNLAAPGGQTGNPFNTPGVDSKNPFHKFNFFLGFNLIRKFKL